MTGSQRPSPGPLLKKEASPAVRGVLRFKGFPRGQGLRLGRLRSKNAAFCVCVLKPTKGIEGAGMGSDSLRPTSDGVACYHARRKSVSQVLFRKGMI